MGWTSSSDGEKTRDAYKILLGSHQETMRKLVYNIMMDYRRQDCEDKQMELMELCKELVQCYPLLSVANTDLDSTVTFGLYSIVKGAKHGVEGSHHLACMPLSESAQPILKAAIS